MNISHFCRGKSWRMVLTAKLGKSSESVQWAITGPCLRMHHKASALRTVLIRKICP